MVAGAIASESHPAKQEEMKMKKTSLSSMNVNQLRDIAVSLGADRKKLYGTSKMSLIMVIEDRIRNNAKEAEKK